MNLSKDTLWLLHVLYADTAYHSIKCVVPLRPVVGVFVQIPDEEPVQLLIALELQQQCKKIFSPLSVRSKAQHISDAGSDDRYKPKRILHYAHRHAW